MKEMLPSKKGREASFSDAIKYQKNLNKDILGVIEKHFSELNAILLNHYHGNVDKAHISKQVWAVLIKAMKSESDYIYVSKKLHEIMEGK